MLEAALRAQGGGVTAFAQNTRDEVRIQGDGTLSGALAAQPGMKQQTYVAEARAYRSNPLPQPVVMASGQSHAEIGEGGLTPTLTAHNGKDAPIVLGSTNSKAGIETADLSPTLHVRGGGTNHGTR